MADDHTDRGPGSQAGQIAASVPMARVGQSKEIAAAVALLLCDDASYITGAHLPHRGRRLPHLNTLTQICLGRG